MQKWEYLEIVVPSRDDKIIWEINGTPVKNQRINYHQYLTRLGQEGWELVSHSGAFLIFKRPIP